MLNLIVCINFTLNMIRQRKPINNKQIKGQSGTPRIAA